MARRRSGLPNLRILSKIAVQRLGGAARIFLIAACCVNWASAAASQRATIGGVVRVATGSSAAGAKVVLRHEESAFEITLRAGTDGSFEAVGLPEGTYSVVVTADGFGPFEIFGIHLTAEQVHRQDFVLRTFPALLSEGESSAGPTGGPTTRTAHGPRPAVRQPPPIPELAASTSVREVRPAQLVQGRSSAGFLPATGRPGSSEFHGAFYSYFGNDVLNARGFFGAKSRHRETNAGAFVGGPVVKNKTFFTYHYERLARRRDAQPGFGNSVPVEAFRLGDFSRLRTGRPVGVDAMGRAMYVGQVFDPASTRRLGGYPVRDAFPNNAVPAAHPLRSRVATGVLPLMDQPDRPGLEYNHQGVPFGLQAWRVDAPSHHLRLDHSFNGEVRAGLLLSRLSRPAVRNCGGPEGCRLRDPSAIEEYSGSGVYEDITTHHVRQQLDWVASKGLLSQLRFVYDEFHIIGHPLSAGGDWQSRLWGPGGNGLLVADAGLPSLNFTGVTRYSPMGSEWGSSGRLANHQYGIGQDLTWIRGRHTLKLGGEFRYHSYPLRGWASNVAGRFDFHRMQTGGFDRFGHNLAETGDPFASFLLGQVHATRFQIPDFPTITESFLAWGVLHEFSATRDLTLTLGLRFDYQSAIREQDDNMSTFDPAVPNPGAGGRLGAMVFAGHGPGRIGSRTLEDPPRDAFGPHIGLAYRLGDRAVIRGSYAVHYGVVPQGQITAVNTFGFRFDATATDLSNGQRAAHHLDSGFPKSAVVLPPAIDPAVGNGTSPLAVTKDRATLPRIQDWSLVLQRQVGRSSSLRLAYYGNRGSRLVADRLVLGPAANSNAPEVLELGADVLGALVTSESASDAGIGIPFTGFRRSAAQSLRPFPQMLHIGYMNVPAGNSFYHAFRASAERRFTKGGLLQLRYAWSKLTGMGAGLARPPDGLDSGPQNPTDTHSLERGLSADDVPQRLVALFTHALPSLRQGKAGLAGKLLRGWSVSGAIRVQSATPVNIVMANDLEPFLFNGQKRPNILTNRVRARLGSDFDAATDRFFDRGAFADPGQLRFGDASRTMDYVRGFRNLAEDFSLFREGRLGPNFKLRLETQVSNALNRVVLCDPNRNWSSASFGMAFAQCNSPRTVRVGLRLDF